MTTVPKMAYSIDEAVQACGIKRTKLYRLMGDGRIEGRVCDGRTLVMVDSLREFLQTLPRFQPKPAGRGGRGGARNYPLRVPSMVTQDDIDELLGS